MIDTTVVDLSQLSTRIGLSVVGIATVTLAYWWTTYDLDGKRTYEHPLPPLASGGFFKVMKEFNSPNFHEYALGQARNEAKIVRLPLWPILPWNMRLMAVYDPKVGRKILENPKAFKPRGIYEMFDSIVGGTCFISEEGERYKHPRKAVLMGISRNTINDMVRMIHEVMDDWIPHALGDEVNEVDIGDEMQKCTIQSIGKIAFGCAISKEEQENTLRDATLAVYEFSIESEMYPWRKIPYLGPMIFNGRRQAEECVKKLRTFCTGMLHHHRSDKSIEEMKEAAVLDGLVTNDKGKAAGGTDDDIVSDMMLLYFAGFDTTGYTISFALLELSKNQDIQTQLRNDLRESTNAGGGDKKQYDCPLLKRVVKETMRLWSVAAAGGGRIIPDDMVVSVDDGKGGERPMTLPKGSLALVCLFPLMRDKDTFDRPDEWLPYRWEDPTQDMKDAFLPFLTGRRSCPGQLLALCESEIFLARLVQDYEWTIVKEVPPTYAVTLKIKGTILQARKVPY
jgi:cytochrome P450 family 6